MASHYPYIAIVNDAPLRVSTLEGAFTECVVRMLYRLSLKPRLLLVHRGRVSDLCYGYYGIDLARLFARGLAVIIFSSGPALLQSAGATPSPLSRDS